MYLQCVFCNSSRPAPLHLEYFTPFLYLVFVKKHNSERVHSVYTWSGGLCCTLRLTRSNTFTACLLRILLLGTLNCWLPRSLPPFTPPVYFYLGTPSHLEIIGPLSVFTDYRHYKLARPRRAYCIC